MEEMAELKERERIEADRARLALNELEDGVTIPIYK